MPDVTFNTISGRTIAREQVVAYLNTGTGANPIWDPLGRRVQDSSTELDWESDTVRDILGNRSTLRRLKITRRVTVPDNEARLAVLAQLEDLAAWAEENPPRGGESPRHRPRGRRRREHRDAHHRDLRRRPHRGKRHQGRYHRVNHVYAGYVKSRAGFPALQTNNIIISFHLLTDNQFDDHTDNHDRKKQNQAVCCAVIPGR